MKWLMARTVLLALVGVAVGAGGVVAQPPADQLLQTAQQLFAPLPAKVDNPANPVTSRKVDLGRMLWHDPRLSLSGFISCNSCHNLATFGTDNLPTSIGHRWAVGPRNSPTVFNAALHTMQFWDGRAATLEEQAKGPIVNPIEMAIPSQEFAVERIASIPEYRRLFAAAFPGQTPALTYTNIANALAVFQRTLMTPDRFDRYLRGDVTALTSREKAGLQVFINLGCAGCHMGPALGGTMMTRFGIVEAYWEATRDFVTPGVPTIPMDVGRFAVTRNPEDLYVFKVPSMRNITRTYPYFHDGMVWNLRDATQVMARVQLGREIPKQEMDLLMAFYQTLEGRIPAHALVIPVLPASTDQTPRPSNR